MVSVTRKKDHSNSVLWKNIFQRRVHVRPVHVDVDHMATAPDSTCPCRAKFAKWRCLHYVQYSMPLPLWAKRLVWLNMLWWDVSGPKNAVRKSFGWHVHCEALLLCIRCWGFWCILVCTFNIEFLCWTIACFQLLPRDVGLIQVWYQVHPVQHVPR